MAYATDGTTPQCENIDIENQDTVRTSVIENQDTVRTSGLRKYFCVHTSDPLLDVVEWISYSTEVSFFHMRDVVLTSFFTQVGPIVIAAWLLILSILLLLPLLPWLPFLLQYLSFQHVVIFAFLSLTGWCYLRFMWLKPSQHLRLGIQQVGTSQAF